MMGFVPCSFNALCRASWPPKRVPSLTELTEGRLDWNGVYTIPAQTCRTCTPSRPGRSGRQGEVHDDPPGSLAGGSSHWWLSRQGACQLSKEMSRESAGPSIQLWRLHFKPGWAYLVLDQKGNECYIIAHSHKQILIEMRCTEHWGRHTFKQWKRCSTS